MLNRPRLVNRLHRHVDLALTLISAPAGYGKTSLLVDFSHDVPFPVCWLSLDESDCDLYIFVEYLVAALRRRFPDFGEPTRRTLIANPDIGRDLTALAGVIMQDMVDNVPELFALVLDDYHTMEGSQEINGLLEALLKYRPDHFHLIVASRTVPPGLPIILLTARQQIAFIGQADLAFTADEVRALMAQMHDIDLTPEQAEALVTESEGWITGILLSTAAMWRGMRDALAQAALRGTGEAGAGEGPVYAYLAEQVFMAQPQALRDFMLVSSTLQEMSGTLCHEALRLTGAVNILRRLERRGVFLTTVVDEVSGTPWYRYHHLFRDFLQTWLQAQDPARFRQLHQQAAEWFEAREQWESAVAHRLSLLSPLPPPRRTAGPVRSQGVQAAPPALWEDAAGRLSGRAADAARAAARTMEAGVAAMFYSKRMRTLVAWYEALPASLRSGFPRLLLFAARALINLGRPDEALPLLHRAEAAFTEQGETERALFAILQRADVWYMQSRYAELLESAQKVLAGAADYPAPAAEARRLAGLACLNLGRPEEAVEHLRASLALHRKLGISQETAMVYRDLSFALSRLGQLSESWECLEKAIEFFRQVGPSNQLALALNNAACERYYLVGDYAQALSYLNEALEAAQAAGAPREQAFALLSTADLYRDLGALEEAKALYAQAEKIALRLGDSALINFALTSMTQVQLLSGDVVEALGLATQACEQAEGRQDVYQLGFSRLTLGAAHLDAGDSEAALAEIERGRDLLAQSGARRELTRAYALLARARQATDDVEGALAAFGQALNLGIETQTFHHLVVEGQRVFGLLKEMLKRNPADRRLAKIMDRIQVLPDVAREVIGGLAPTALPHPPSLRFYGFGLGTVEKDGESIPVSAWRSALARYLTFYLLVHPPRSRDQITATFWPDTSQDKAGGTFHWVKSQIKSALGRPLVLYQDGLYQAELEPDCWFDVAAFESLLDGQDGRQARLERVVALYQGDFLEGYDGEWCRPIRERLRLRFRNALVELGEIYTAQGQFDYAFAVLSRTVAIDDLHEPAVRALMRLHALDGRRRAALNLFDQLKQRLRQELNASPAPETQALYQAIQSGNIAAPS